MWYKDTGVKLYLLAPQSSPHLIVKLQNFFTLGERDSLAFAPPCSSFMCSDVRKAKGMGEWADGGVLLGSYGGMRGAWGLQFWRSSPVNLHTVRAAVRLPVVGLYLCMERVPSPFFACQH